MFLIAYAFKGQVHVFEGRVKTESHSLCRTCAILKYICPLWHIEDEEMRPLSPKPTIIELQHVISNNEEF